MIQANKECKRQYWAEDEFQETATTTVPQEFVAFSASSVLSSNEQRPFMVFLRTPSEDPPFKARSEKRWGKYYWGVMSGPGISQPQRKNYVFTFEVSEEKLGHPENVIGSASQWPALWRKNEEFDPTVWRGVFPLVYKRKVIFSQKIEMRTADMPRWKPQIILERRVLEGDNV